MLIKYYYSRGHKYARLLEAKRDENGNRYGVLYCQLGRVIDEEEGIFRSRGRGTFRYNLDKGFADIEDPKAYIEQTYGSKLERFFLNCWDGTTIFPIEPQYIVSIPLFLMCESHYTKTSQQLRKGRLS